jgi:CBS domain-containing membrane protein
MTATGKPLVALTAADLMSSPVVTIPREMPLPEADQLLVREQLSGAPVVDGQGRCVGVLSSTDFVRWAEARAGVATPRRVPRKGGPGGQAGGPDEHRAEAAGEYMTADPVAVRPGAGIRDVARVMLDAHIHRVAVVDEQRRLLGLISSTDVLAAVAYAGRR